ncbi:DUF5666 domain-containing protein [Mycobacterium sp. 1081908.1]|uniref:DUF5666 domain-containing protein n=1 Tax=Mycobacterium sp. 1081908.1 TaxID=1834066 RepID=UPI001E5400DD|nr:DUF5666 domain-containing protein [Mycobacterium sp. 1081908.1]
MIPATRLAILAVTGAAALSVAACGSSNQSSPTSTSTSTVTSTATSQAPPQGEAKVSGLIASVAGNSIRVTKDDNSSAAVNFTSTTKVTEVAPATLSDVTQGSCVTVRPTKEVQTGQPTTAASVRVSPSVNGTCPPAKGSGQGSTTPPPSGSPSPAPAKPKPLAGSVASVTGNTITVAGTDASGNSTQTPVTVDDQTKYSKLATATPDAIAQGKCVTARGSLDNGGTLQATSINVRAAVDGKCPGKPRG